jgi:hypothetical protein
MQQASGRKPINAGDETSIFNAQPTNQIGSANGGGTLHRSPSINPTSNTNNTRYDYTPPQSGGSGSQRSQMTYTPPRQRQQQQQQPQHQMQQSKSNSNLSNSGPRPPFNTRAVYNATIPREPSPVRSNNNANAPDGFRIAKRELWWKEPPPSQHKVLLNQKQPVDHVTPRIDCYNPDYSPHRESSKIIESRKLEWKTNHGKFTFKTIRN